MSLTHWLQDVWIRRRYAERLYAAPMDRFQVRVARTVEEHRSAFRLLHVAYAYEGLEPVDAEQMRITPQHVLPESTLLVAYEDDQLVGTLTVTLDSTGGLPLEHDYGDAIAALRQQPGMRLAEYGSLAVVRRCWHAGVTTLLNMAAHWFATKYLQATHVVAGVNPRIAAYYRAFFTFSPLGPPRPHAELSAPVQGVFQDLAHAERWGRTHLKRPASSGLPLWEHFTEALPYCIDLPAIAEFDARGRWKQPPNACRRLLIEDRGRIDKLNQTLPLQTPTSRRRWATLPRLRTRIGRESPVEKRGTSATL